jgi:quinol monooxygenase YgiN
MPAEIVFALYRPHPGREAELRKILARHVPTLRRLEMATDREPIVVKSKNGTLVEIFEWATSDAAEKAHHHPEVAKVWEAIGKIADMPVLDSLEEAKQRFPHFEPVQL